MALMLTQARSYSHHGFCAGFDCYLNVIKRVVYNEILYLKKKDNKMSYWSIFVN